MENFLSLDDQTKLNLTNKIREDIIKALTENGLPDNDKDRKFLLAALNGLDRSILTKARIKAQNNSNDVQVKATNMIAQLLYRFSENNINDSNKERKLDLDKEYKVEDLVPGETDQGIQQLTYHDFFKE